jgi:hypothetical protein
VSKSSGGLFGRKGPAQVTVLETKVRHASFRNARVAFIVTALLVGALSALVLSDRMHPILAVLAGLAIGAVAGSLVGFAVLVWPVVRIIWWWSTEIVLVVLLLAGWTALANGTPLWVRFVVVGLVLGVPAVVPAIRRHVVALAWCVIVRHRLRVAFSQFIVSNKSGSLPFILAAVPTPVGERVWVCLRAGLSLPLLQQRVDQLAVACHATTVQVVRAGRSNAAFVRFDIKRREVLTATIGSPLLDMVDPSTPQPKRTPGDLPTAINLGDIPQDATLFATYTPSSKTAGKRPATSTSANGSKPAAPADDSNEWI